MGIILVIIIWCIVVVAGVGVSGLYRVPSLGRRALPRKEHPDYAEIDRLERELKMGKYTKTAAEFDAEVERAVHPPEPAPEPPPSYPYGVEMPMFKDYEEYAAWMRARYPGWHG